MPTHVGVTVHQEHLNNGVLRRPLAKKSDILGFRGIPAEYSAGMHFPHISYFICQPSAGERLHVGFL